MDSAAAEDSARPRTSLPLLTALTAPAYCLQLGLFPHASGTALEATELTGGNLNFAFHVHDSTAQGVGVFVKQTPGYVKVLGPGAKLSDQRLLTERRAYSAWEDSFGASDAAATACLPRVLHFDSERMIMVMGQRMHACTHSYSVHVHTHAALHTGDGVPGDLRAPT